MTYYVVLAIVMVAQAALWYYAGKVSGRNDERKRSNERTLKFIDTISTAIVEGQYDDVVREASMIRMVHETQSEQEGE